MWYSKGAPSSALKLLSVLLTLWMPLCGGVNIQLIPSVPHKNETVLLNVINVAENILSISWYKGSMPSASTQILTYLPGSSPPQIAGAQYFPEASCFANGSLLIIGLKKEFEGNYTVQIQLSTLKQDTVFLRVEGESIPREKRKKESQKSAESVIKNVLLTLCIYAEKVGTPKYDGLTPGAIVGIVIGVLAILSIVIVIGFLFFKKGKTQSEAVSRGSPPSGYKHAENGDNEP
ncbi:carcinoembryonic antigen-related cell adhesion molecule 19 [Spea bombifrons]|uniref:carcinoembryonic antigen-related cell adhesion molecule 19 n=1 Tax=Spea bombifrons TaxID=233779 RepID=UPI00234985AC|nr:carcinoembryonic antigen-related cell adhesion molecule 19 [Spea bombifrons]